MSKETATDLHEACFTAFGVRAAVQANRPELLERARELLPPGSQACSGSEVEHRFSISVDHRGVFEVAVDGHAVANPVDVDFALGLLDSQLRIYVARKALGRVFIHAGVVAHQGKAIAIPGRSFAGKTTLVAALIRAGAVYYSDEFAVLDEEGLVYPYAKPLSLRQDDFMQTDVPVSDLGGVTGERPISLGAIVVTTYRPDARWEPSRLSAGQGVLALLANAVPARERPSEVMRAISRAAQDAVVIESDRGDADAVARALLADLDRELLSET